MSQNSKDLTDTTDEALSHTNWNFITVYEGQSDNCTLHCLSFNIQYINMDMDATQDTAATLMEKYLLFNIIHII